MDIVKFFSDQVSKWNDDNKCGFCWEFGAPLTRVARQRGATYHQTTNLLTSTYCDYSFNLHVVRKGDLGTNNYNEISGHPIEESRWNEIYNPIAECLDCNLQLDFCEFLGIQANQIAWSEEMERAYTDNNYYGWKITAKFRINNP